MANSCESCWLYPMNCSACLPRVYLKSRGYTTDDELLCGVHDRLYPYALFGLRKVDAFPALVSELVPHISDNKLANSVASSPPVPRGLSRFKSLAYSPDRKYDRSGPVCAKH